MNAGRIDYTVYDSKYPFGSRQFIEERIELQNKRNPDFIWTIHERVEMQLRRINEYYYYIKTNE